MFDTAIIHKPGIISGKVDAGRVFETLLYYDRVHLVMDGSLFRGLWDFCGPSNLARLLRLPGLTACVTPEMTAIHTETRAGLQIHRPIQFRSSGRDNQLLDVHDVLGSLQFMLNSNTERSTTSRSDLKKVLGRTKITNYSKLIGRDSAIERFDSLLSDDLTLKLFFRSWAYEKGTDIDFSFLRRSHLSARRGPFGFEVDADRALNEIHDQLGEKSSSSWAHVLSMIQDYEIALYLSQRFSADVVTSSGASEVASQRLDLAIERANKAREQISHFEEMEIEGAHAFAESINSRSISLEDGFAAIKEAKRFRTWTRNLAPDADLITEYYKAIARETIVGSAPRSIARFSFFNGMGMVADKLMPGAGLALSAFDQFVLEKLLRGWRPNIFVRNLRRRLDRARQ